MATTSPLRPVVQRLNNTAVQDLPRYAGFLASLILQYQQDLQRVDSSNGGDKVLIHKLKARISSLLQDRTSEGRFTGIVLAKSIIDAGELGDSEFSATWTRMLLSCLNKQDAPEIKRLAIVTLTRIFVLTIDQPPLVREITTPNLPSFISITLGLVRPVEVSGSSLGSSVTSPLLDTVLSCWLHLLPEFASMFRPYLSSFHAITLNLMGDINTPQATRSLATAVFAAMHHCAPKNAAGADWFQTCEKTIIAVHQNANVLFRSVVENWRPSSQIQQATTAVGGNVTAEVRIKTPDAIGMEKWSGLRSGVCRLATLFRLLSRLLTTRHSQAMSVPIASVLEVCSRLAAIAPPTKSLSMENNSEFSRDEREELWPQVSYIHILVLEFLQEFVTVYGHLLRPVSKTIMAQVFDMYEAGKFSGNVRAATRRTLVKMLEASLVQISPPEQKLFVEILWQCCDDLKSHFNHANRPSISTFTPLQSTDEGTTSPKLLNDHISAAWDLLPIVLIHASAYLSSNLRAEIDSCVILAGHKRGMLASVLNPSRVRKGSKLTSSILPFFARIQTCDLSSEALLRPRMPLIRSALSTSDAEEVDYASEKSEEAANIPDLEVPVQEQDAFRDTPAKKMESDTAVMANESSKRTFDTIGTEFNQQRPFEDPQSLKRSKTETVAYADSQDSVVPKYNDMINSEVVVSRANTSDKSQQAGNTVSNAIITSPPNPSFELTQDTVPATNSSTAQKWDSLDREDDSDDEEIPAIDATMSDEDSNEAMSE